MEKLSNHETIIYGGAFNPPTLAHQAILQACVDYAEPRGSDVWVLPSASRTDKLITVERDRRLAFCEALMCDVMRRTVRLAVDTTELDSGFLTETFDTAQALKDRYPEREFRWVFGADSVATMREWKNGEWLEENLSMLLVNRPGAPLVPVGQRTDRLVVDAGWYSSTELRRRLAHNEPYDDMVGPQVGVLLADEVLS